jgi:hypothetical protein
MLLAFPYFGASAPVGFYQQVDQNTRNDYNAKPNNSAFPAH